MKLFQGILILIVGFIIGGLSVYSDIEYKRLQDNSIKFEWEGLEEDIPEDGIVTVQFKTNENTVYINPVDE